MSTARVVLKQGTATYRFLGFETSPDGSVIAFMDRDARPKRGAMTTNERGIFVPDEVQSDRALPSAKFSIHTTGVVHRYASGKRQNTIHIEPLHALTKLATIGFISIPRVSRLDLLNEDRHKHDTTGALIIPEGVSDRLTFNLEIGPSPQQPQTYGVALNYEIYSAVVRVIPNFLALPPEMADHFIHGMATEGQFDKRQIDQASAELGFYQRIHGRHPFIFREDKGGRYIIMAVVSMVKAPKLTIGFNRPDLYIEIIPYKPDKEPCHKVRFWICDKGGRNKTEDLRHHIISVELDANL